ncbi:nucleoside hydrolase [Candidatus Poribacteria bacterium]|nr:MAG: nucleoside hydrolase [Candidatus Poribacteria bacterium]
MDEKIPVLFDTDIGSDIDDAVCLAYLLCQPRCELVGITTVTGEPEKRAMLASAICKAAGRDDVPIFSGSPRPMLIEQAQKTAPQAEVLPRWEHRTDFEPCAAVEFMRRTIRSRPGEIVLLAVGPLTNVGLLFAMDPEIPSMLRGLVLMNGAFTGRLPALAPLEWNARGDPHATAIVYRNAPPGKHISIGLDVTTRCVLPAEECRRRFKGGPLDVVADMAEVWFRRAGAITFHDPLAAAVIFEPDLCKYEEGKVEVEISSARLAGLTLWNPNAAEKPHKIAVDVDPDRFFEHYFSVVGG